MENISRLVQDDTGRDISSQSISFILQKFRNNNYNLETLRPQQLAIAVTTSSFRQQLLKQTGLNWAEKFQSKASQLLMDSQIDMNWMMSSFRDKFMPLFVACSQGNLDHVKELFHQLGATQALGALDVNTRNCLHLAAKHGHLKIVEYLVQLGFNVNSRDQMLVTPFHLACRQGHENVCDLLIRSSTDMKAVDSEGRSALHYACSGSNSTSTVLMVASLQQELVNQTDLYGLSPLHYITLNPQSASPGDVIKKLAETGCDFNIRDKDGRTALFYAAQQGKIQIIPTLLQMGSNPDIKDSIAQKSAVDVASNDRVRDLITTYQNTGSVKNSILYQTSSSGFGQDDLHSPRGGMGPSQIAKSQLNNGGDLKNMTTRSNNWMEAPFEKTMKLGGNASEVNFFKKTGVVDWVRQRYIELMKTIQENGIRSRDHMKNPSLYTGSWMEQIQTLEELFVQISTTSSTEVCLSTFNILFPYEKPVAKLDTSSVVEPDLEMIGKDLWLQSVYTQQQAIEKFILNQKKEFGSGGDKKQIAEFESLRLLIQKKDQTIKQQLEEIKQLQTQLESQPQPTGGSNPKLEEENQQLKQDLRKEKQKVGDMLMEIQYLQIQTETFPNGLVPVGAVEEIEKLKENRKKEIILEREHRMKAGQLFLKALNGKGSPEKVTESAYQFNFYDDEAVINMLQAIKSSKFSIEQLLTKSDADKDRKINILQFIQFLRSIHTASSDINSLLNIFGFNSGRKSFKIQEFKEILLARQNQRQEEQLNLFVRMLEGIEKSGLKVQQWFIKMDEDQNGLLSLQEFKKAMQNLNIFLNARDYNNLFNLLDEGQQNQISLVELRKHLFHIEEQISGSQNNSRAEDSKRNGDSKNAEFDKAHQNQMRLLSDISEIGNQDHNDGNDSMMSVIQDDKKKRDILDDFVNKNKRETERETDSNVDDLISKRSNADSLGEKNLMDKFDSNIEGSDINENQLNEAKQFFQKKPWQLIQPEQSDINDVLDSEDMEYDQNDLKSLDSNLDDFNPAEEAQQLKSKLGKHSFQQVSIPQKIPKKNFKQ